jgi:hypothetical protein
LEHSTPTPPPVGPYDIDLDEVREDRLVGVRAAPRGRTGAPAVLVLSGSGGGVPLHLAAEVAAEGFLVLGLAYFGAPGLPADLVEVPVETVAAGVDWLSRRAPPGHHGVALLGESKGAELALLAATLLPTVRRVAAYAPSHVVWECITRWHDPARSSWSWLGKPVPFVPYLVTPEFEEEDASGRPVRLVLLYGASLSQEEKVRRAAIPLERIGGPVLLVSGRDDQMWPSTRMADAAMARLRAGGHPHASRHLSYAHAGHFSGPPAFGDHARSPAFAYGGTPAGDAAARADSWPRVLAFLRGGDPA